MFSRIFQIMLMFAAIAFSLFCGKLINAQIGGLPGSLYGLLLFTVILNTRVLDSSAGAEFIGKLIYFMPLVFVPVCVGLMNYFDLLAKHGLIIISVGMVSTLFGILVTVSLCQFALRHQANQEDSDV